jgi:hypothetical protein
MQTGIRRDPRLPFHAIMDVVVAGRAGGATACNVSQHGACFVCRVKVARGDALHLALAGIGLRAAVVRHAKLSHDRFTVGVEFFEPLSVDEVSSLADD